jgi:hypothetical protein
MSERSLSQFAYDVFVSYGWAGMAEGEGDRAWVARLTDVLAAEIAGQLGRAPRIFLDVEQPRNGTLDARLTAAATSSVVFLSVITPGSCRAGSWCHTELKTFLGDAPPILPNCSQLFTALLRDVPRVEWPEALRPIAPYEFLTESKPRGPLPLGHLGDTSTPCGALAQKLGIEIGQTLCDAAGQIEHTVLFASADPALDAHVARLSREITARNGRAVAVSARDGEAEAVYAARIARELQRSSLSIHLLTAATPPPPDGWALPVETVQRRAAAVRFEHEPKRIIIWRDGNQPIDVAADGEQMLRGTGFEYLHSLMCDVYAHNLDVATATAARRKEAAGADAGAAPGRLGAMQARRRYLFVDCVQQDLFRLKPLRAVLEAAGVQVKFPLFQGDAAIRLQADREFLARCDGVAVYFGSRNDLEAYLACQNLSNGIRDNGVAIPRAVILDPADDPVRQVFLYPDFVNYPGVESEEFINAVAGRVAA